MIGKDLNLMLSNCYTFFVILIRENLNHPMIFRAVVEQLISCTRFFEAYENALQLLTFVVLNVNLKIIDENLIMICSKLVSNFAHDFHPFLDFIKNIFQLMNNLSGNRIHLAISVFNHKFPKFESLFSKFNVDPYDILNLSKVVEIAVRYSHINIYPLLRIESLLDDYSACFRQIPMAFSLLQNLKRLLKSPSIENSVKNVLHRLILKFNIQFKWISQYRENDYLLEKHSIYTGFRVALDYLKDMIFSTNFKLSEIAIDTCGRLLSLSDEISEYMKDMDILKRPLEVLSPSHIADKIDNQSIWHSNGRTESQWILIFTSSLLRSFDKDNIFGGLLANLLLVDPDFATLMLPYIIHYQLHKEREICSKKTLTANNLQYRQILSSQFKIFFSSATKNDGYIVRHFLDTIYFLNSIEDDSLPWLELDYFSISNAALLTSSYLDGLFNIEKWFASDKSSADVANIVDHSLLECYKGINDKDAFHGALSVIDVSKCELPDLLQQKHEHDSHWESICKIQDARLQIEHCAEESVLFNALSKSGYFHIIQKMGARTKNTHYESLWKLGAWDLPCSTINSTQNEDIYFCLKNLESGNVYLKDFIAEKFMSSKLKYISMLPLLEINESLSFLDNSTTYADKMLKAWDKRLEILKETYPFEDIEPLLASRTRILTSMTKVKELGTSPELLVSLDDYFATHLLQVSELAITSGAEIFARKSLALFSENFLGDNIRKYAWKYKLASYKLEWIAGNKLIALKYIKNLANDMDLNNISPLNQAEVYYLCGKWTDESRAL